MIDEEKKGLKPEINHSDNSMNIDSHIENSETFKNVASSNTITSWMEDTFVINLLASTHDEDPLASLDKIYGLEVFFMHWGK